MILYLFKNFILNKIYLLIENKYYFINFIFITDLNLKKYDKLTSFYYIE